MAKIPDLVQGHVKSAFTSPNHAIVLTTDGYAQTIGGLNYSNIKAPQHIQGKIKDATIGINFSI